MRGNTLRCYVMQKTLVVFGLSLADVFTEINVAHVTRSKELGVECKRSLECVGSLAATGRHLQVVAEKLAIHGMCAIVDDDMGTLYGVKTTKIGDTLVSYDYVDRVLGVVHVRYHRYDVRDLAFLGD